MQLMYDVKKIHKNGIEEIIKRCDTKEQALLAVRDWVKNSGDLDNISIVAVMMNDDFSDPTELSCHSCEVK